LWLEWSQMKRIKGLFLEALVKRPRSLIMLDKDSHSPAINFGIIKTGFWDGP